MLGAPHFYNKAFKEPKIEIKGALPTTGTISVIFLMVEFSDIKFSNHDFTSLINGMKDYYYNASAGKLSLDCTITQTFALDKTMGYYGNPERPGELRDDVIEKARSKIALSKYHSIMILHAGTGDETQLNETNQIRSTTLGTISIIPEMENFGIFPLGVWCHEFGHQLGLLDLDNASYWSLMDIGCYNGNGVYPAYPDAYSRIKLGWVNITGTTSLILTPSSNGVYQLGVFPDYFLVEKRDEHGIPSSGFLVWHIDGNKNIALLQADNNGIFDSGDPFPGPTRNCLLDDNTKPSLRHFDGKPSGFKIEILIPHVKYKAFPNPIDLNKTKRVFFEVERSSSCDIYNIKGELIKSLYDYQNAGRIYWDIDNVASGVYIFVIKDKLGNKFFGKLGIIK